MNSTLIVGGILTILLALAHSYLGEKLLLQRLFSRCELPKLLGSRDFARRTLRFAWHLTTLLMVSIGTVAIAVGTQTQTAQASLILKIFAVMFVGCSLLSLIGARGRHFSWYVFAVIGVLLWIGAS